MYLIVLWFLSCICIIRIVLIDTKAATDSTNVAKVAVTVAPSVIWNKNKKQGLITSVRRPLTVRVAVHLEAQAMSGKRIHLIKMFVWVALDGSDHYN